MKHRTLLAIVLLACAGWTAIPVLRAEEPVKEKKVSKRDLAKYDTDKDGKLSAEEQAAMKADKQRAKAEREQKKKEKEKEQEKPEAAEPAGDAKSE